MGGCPNQASPNICDYGIGNPVVIASPLGIATTPELGAILDINTGNTVGWVRFNSNLPYALRLGQHYGSGWQFIGSGITKTGMNNDYVAISGNNPNVNHSVIEFAGDGTIRFLVAPHQPDGTVLTMQTTAMTTPTGQFVVGSHDWYEPNAAMLINPTTDKWVKLHGFMRIVGLQSGSEFISMGIAKTGPDNNYIANTQNNPYVNHSALQFGYDGSLQYLSAPHQSDGTQLNSLLAPAFAVSGTTDATFGHIGIGATPSANRLEVGGNLRIASGGLIFPDGTQQTTAGATVSVGTTNTGAPGSRAQVTNSGTASAAILNFTIPQGIQGPPGPRIGCSCTFGCSDGSGGGPVWANNGATDCQAVADKYCQQRGIDFHGNPVITKGLTCP
jgi:hypothetical protein